MKFKNTEIKLDTLVLYFNEERINLNPVFQRGIVWKLPARKQLLKNVVLGRPIPAIFVYKGDDGSRYVFNILDGKQRLESLLLFIGYARPDFKIKTWAKYIPNGAVRDEVNFAAPVGTAKKQNLTLAQLDDEVVRELREFPIAMIEITMSEDEDEDDGKTTTLDEIISLFVDINQKGQKVTRLQIVRALKRNDRFLKDVYELLAEKQERERAILVKRKKVNFVYVLKHLQMISSIEDADQQADRMWERLFELALYVRSGKHRKPTEILKSFIKAPDVAQPKLTGEERKKLRSAFDFLAESYRRRGLAKTRFATDQTHFYTMVTTILGKDLLSIYEPDALAKALVDFNAQLDRASTKVVGMQKLVKKYKELSAKQTSDSARRESRQDLLMQAIELLVGNGKKK